MCIYVAIPLHKHVYKTCQRPSSNNYELKKEKRKKREVFFIYCQVSDTKKGGIPLSPTSSHSCETPGWYTDTQRSLSSVIYARLMKLRSLTPARVRVLSPNRWFVTTAPAGQSVAPSFSLRSLNHVWLRSCRFLVFKVYRSLNKIMFENRQHWPPYSSCGMSCPPPESAEIPHPVMCSVY